MPENIPELPFEDTLRQITGRAVRAVGPFPQDKYVSGIVVDYVQRKWSEEIGDHYHAWTKVIEHPAIAGIDFTEHGSPLDSVLARLDELAEIERERADLKVEVRNLWASAGRKSAQIDKLLRQQKTAHEFVPHFKLHRDGSITPQQDDTPVWTMGTMHEDVPVALIVTEDAVKEVEVTQEAASWRAGGTGVPTSWNLDKLREMRDGALTEWIEVEAIIREVEKRENDPVQKMVAEIQDILYPYRNDISDDEARRVEDLARYLVKKEQS